MVKLDSTGEIQWQKRLGGSGDDQAHNIQSTNDGGYIMAGCTASNNGDVSGNHGAKDAWIAKLNSLTGTEDIQSNINWQLFPNPTTGILEIQTDENTPFTLVAVIDIFGRHLIEQEINSDGSIDLSNLPNGVYIVSVLSKERKTYQKKIVKK
jgi:hypothetical protein